MSNKKTSLIILLIIHSFFSFAQMTIDTVKHTVCYGKDITLNASSGQFYKWDNGSSANSQTVSTLINKSVEVLVYDSPQGNLVQNGNFDQGDVSFGSDYDFILSTPELQEGLYSITPDASKVHWAFKGFGKTDIAHAGTDNFMAVNGSYIPNSIVWEQTISVEPNTLYAFSCLTTNLYSSVPALLQFFIDGVQIGNTFSTTMTGDWDQFYQTWSSGSQTSVTIKILNQNTTGVGNDFALDDIFFAKITARKEVHKISVFKPAVDLGIDKAFCASGILDAGAGFDSYEWNTGATTQTIQVNTGGNYNVKVSKNGCDATSSVLVAINLLPVVGAISNISAICEGDTRELSIDNSNLSSTYTWKVSGAVSNPTTGTGQTFSITAGTSTIDIEVLEKDANDCISSSARTASISIDKKPTTAIVGNSFVCANAIATATGNQPVIGQGRWVVDVLNTTAGYSIDDLASYNSNVTKAGVVSYGDKLTAAWEISNGVCPVSKQTMVLSFQPLSNRLFTLATDNTPICEGKDVVFTATIDGSQVGNMPVYKLFDGLGNLVPSTPVLKDTTQATFTLQNVTSNLNGYYVERTSNSIPCLASSLIKTTPKSVTVDKKPTRANIIEDKLVVCSAEKEINFDQLNIGTAAWTVKNGNQGSVMGTSATKAKTSGLVVGQSSTFYLTATNGTCPSTKDSVLITRTGNPTSPTVKSQSDSICETAAAPKLTGTPINTSAIATETGTWSSVGAAKIDNTGQTNGLVVGENKFVYTISNGICQPDLTDTVTITVIKAPISTIQLPIEVNSTDNPSTKNISNLNPSIWIGAKQTAGYVGKWSVSNGATAIGLKGGNVSVLADSLLLKNFNDKTTATWTVQDLDKKCSEAKATIEVIRKNYNTAFAGKDTSICISSLPLSWSGNDFSATDEAATWSLVSSNPAGATVAQVGTSKNVTFNATDAGVYEFEYKIVNATLNITTKDIIKLTVDKKPTKANIIEDKLVVCSAEKEIDFDQITIGTATWTVKNGNQGSVMGTSATKAKTSGLVIGQSSTFYLTATNGTCPATKDSVLITRTGNPTSPAVKSQNDSICETAVAPKLTGTPINTSAIATETATWSSFGAAQIDNAGQTNGLVVGENKFVYTISNGICQPDLADTVTITVIKAPLAAILLPIDVKSTDIPSTKSISNLNPSIWIGAKQTAGYVGKWSVTNGATAIGLKGGNVSVLSDSLLLKNFNDKTSATWTVQDLGKKCSEAKATIEVIRKNYNTAFAGKDTSICISSLPLSWSGNDFSATDETATWSLVSSNPAGATVTQVGTSKNATFNAANAGVYEFEYKIVNTTLGITTKDTLKIKVDAKPDSPSFTQSSPINTCLDKLNLPANSAGPIPTAIGTWKIDKSQPITTQTISNPKNPNSLLEKIPSSSVTKLFWVVQNGVCKKDSIALVVNQIGTITPATIRLNGTEIKGSDTSLCMSTIHSLEGSTPSNDPIKGETNTWNITGTSVSISGGNATTQALTLNAVGESQISYTIKNNDPNCIASVKTIKIKVNDIPVLDQITGVPNLCEGKSESYSLSLKTGLGINTEPISAYNWNAISSVTGTSTLQGSGIGSSATFSFKSTSNTGSTDTASIKVFAQNACGNSLPLTKKIAIDLKPRDFLGDIIGSTNVCESAIANEKYTILPQANTTSYVWALGNKTLSGTQPMLETSIPISELVAQKPTATLKVTLSNVCGVGVEKTKSITIIPAVQVDAKITGQNRVCLPTDNMLYQGSSTNAGTNPIYTFEIIHSNGSIGKTQTSSIPDFATLKGDLEDGDKIKLTIIGDATSGCFSSAGTDQLQIDGYEFPDSTITVSKDSICEGDGVITLRVKSTFNQNNKKNDNGNIQWYFVKGSIDSLLSNFNGLYFFNISKANESGTYKVKVPGSVCIHDSKAEQVVKIYEKPIIRVLQDPMEVIYQDGISVPMPVAISGLKNDTISKAEWTPETWLSTANKLDVKFVPKREKKEIDYTLTISTGSGSIKCETQANVKVINTLPLIIPNAFSPNGDGVNDVWEIQGLTKYKSVTITVFNRWGNTVFFSKGEYTPWDGTINGIPMSVATYYAIIELKESLDNSDQTITQPLTIVR